MRSFLVLLPFFSSVTTVEQVAVPCELKPPWVWKLLARTEKTAEGESSSTRRLVAINSRTQTQLYLEKQVPTGTSLAKFKLPGQILEPEDACEQHPADLPNSDLSGSSNADTLISSQLLRGPPTTLLGDDGLAGFDRLALSQEEEDVADEVPAEEDEEYEELTEVDNRVRYPSPRLNPMQGNGLSPSRPVGNSPEPSAGELAEDLAVTEVGGIQNGGFKGGFLVDLGGRQRWSSDFFFSATLPTSSS